MTAQRRVVLFAVITVAAIVVIAGYVVAAAMRHDAPASSSSSAAAPRPPLAAGDTLVLDRDRRRPKAWGRLVVIGPDGVRHVGSLTCERVAYAAGSGICLAVRRTFPTPTDEARFFDARQRVTGAVELSGSPSRARVSPDGHYAASTTFVSGDGYTNPGQFSTRTTIYDARAHRALGELESFTVIRDGRPFNNPDFNFWGVTFIGGTGGFYATLATGSHHYLVRGDLGARRLTVVRDGVECPSLSPDGTRIGFKARVGHPFQWRFHVLDLGTGRETALPGQGSVDDQIAWLDDAHLAYGDGEVVMTVDADGRTAPRELLASATNPGRIR
ncbi:hypothetical protein FSW04_15540 [Baekduia soli]|uniref:TolB-like translocation protein n=1 Tax=Baekduia soli TaxID=496014 RepID=A0A5B8U7D0_9ACTN|nr:hypothetical protein [Baekduia soli]QEC48847.1 hypothetical protein FSW04_15540 [Baekduia soli]